MRKLLSVLALFAVTVSGAVHATPQEVTVPDPNYALCDGIGAFATGSVTLKWDSEAAGGATKVSSLQVLGFYPNITVQAAGVTVSYTAADGSAGKVLLVKPWYNQMFAPPVPKVDMVLPPLNPGTTSRTGKPFTIKSGTAVKIALAATAVHETAPAGCPFSFDHDINPK